MAAWPAFPFPSPLLRVRLLPSLSAPFPLPFPPVDEQSQPWHFPHYQSVLLPPSPLSGCSTSAQVGTSSRFVSTLGCSSSLLLSPIGGRRTRRAHWSSCPPLPGSFPHRVRSHLKMGFGRQCIGRGRLLLMRLWVWGFPLQHLILPRLLLPPHLSLSR